MCGDGFSGEEAVQGGAADAELAGGAKLVVAVELEDELDVAMDGCVEAEIAAWMG